MATATGTRCLAGLLVLVGVGFLIPPVAGAADWTVSVRTGYAVPAEGAPGDGSQGFTTSALLSHPVLPGVSLVGSIGHVGVAPFRFPGSHLEFVHSSSPCPCSQRVRGGHLIPAGLGIRIGGEQPEGTVTPWIEFLPGFLQGVWYSGDNDSRMSRLLSAWQVGAGVPIRLSESTYLSLGATYLRAPDIRVPVSGWGGFPNPTTLFFLGGFSYRTRAPGR